MQTGERQWCVGVCISATVRRLQVHVVSLSVKGRLKGNGGCVNKGCAKDIASD
jgi:hypothetical protein